MGEGESGSAKRAAAVLILLGLTLVVVCVTVFLAIDITPVHGNQLGVKETWSEGVEEKPYLPRTYVLFPAWTQTIYRYDMTPHIFVMNNRTDDERANGRDKDAYVARSSDNQTLTLDLALQWHYDPAKIIEIHKRYKTHADIAGWEAIIEERVIRQNLMSAVNTAVTSRKAIDAYSGEGFVSMQSEIYRKLIDPDGELRAQGIVIENFVIERITLDADYIGEINKRQVAEQRELRAKKEEQAALAEAQRAKAEAQADYEKQLVEARRKKETTILESEAVAQRQINAAKADAESRILAANAERDAANAKAQAILAIGQAEAEAQRLRLSAYAAQGSEAFVTIEVAKSMAEAFRGIQGYLPADMHVNLLSENFLQAVRSVVRPNGTSRSDDVSNSHENNKK